MKLHRFIHIFLITLIFAVAGLSTTYAGVEQQKITLSAPVVGGTFGRGVAVDGNTALVGQSVITGTGKGSAAVFTYNGTNWVQQQILIASDGVNGDHFGYSVALQGTTALIGAIDRNGQRGAVYVFTYNGMSWIQQQILTASDAGAGHRFSTSVSIDGTSAVVGAPFNGAGAGYVFTFNGTSWVQQAKLTASDGQSGDLLGYNTTAISGDRVLIGAPHDRTTGSGSDHAPGAAYIFVRSGTSWSQQQKLTGDASVSEFGFGSALEDDFALVGAIYEGIVYAFQWNGSAWERIQKFNAAEGTTINPSDRFGWSIDLSGSQAIIGAVGASGNGHAYIFSRTGTTWSKLTSLDQSDPSDDSFGDSVAFNGTLALVGAPYHDDAGHDSGSVYAYLPGDIDNGELLVNGGFEVDTDGDFVPDGWRRKNSTGDGQRCNKSGQPPVAFEGQCAYLFKDDPSGANKLVQNVDLDIHDLNAGDNVRLTGFYNKQSTGSVYVWLFISYSSLPEDQARIVLTKTTAGYQPVNPISLRLRGKPTRVRVELQNLTTSGKTFFDGMSLQWTSAGGADALPLPPSQLIPLP